MFVAPQLGSSKSTRHGSLLGLMTLEYQTRFCSVAVPDTIEQLERTSAVHQTCPNSQGYWNLTLSHYLEGIFISLVIPDINCEHIIAATRPCTPTVKQELRSKKRTNRNKGLYVNWKYGHHDKIKPSVTVRDVAIPSEPRRNSTALPLFQSITGRTSKTCTDINRKARRYQKLQNLCNLHIDSYNPIKQRIVKLVPLSHK